MSTGYCFRVNGVANKTIRNNPPPKKRKNNKTTNKQTNKQKADELCRICWYVQCSFTRKIYKVFALKRSPTFPRRKAPKNEYSNCNIWKKNRWNIKIFVGPKDPHLQKIIRNIIIDTKLKKYFRQKHSSFEHIVGWCVSWLGFMADQSTWVNQCKSCHIYIIIIWSSCFCLAICGGP